MARRKTADLTMKETFINNMIKDSIEHTKGFDPNLISNGEYTFGDFIVYLKLAKKYEDFKIWFNSMKDVEFNGYTFSKMYLDEVSDDDLPFARQDFSDEE